jgi:hypothetical protein
MRLTSGRVLGLAVAVVAGTAFQASAAILYSTGFDSPTYSDGGLAGQDSWAAHSGAGTNAQTVANTATNGNVTLTTSGEDTHRNWVGAVTSGSVYLSADITVNSAQTGDYFLTLGDGGSSNFYDRLYVKSTGAGTFAMALGTAAGTPGAGAYGANLNIGTTYHIVAEYDMVSGAANDTGAVYVNPTDPIFGDTNASPSFYVAAVTQGTDASSILGVYMRQGSGSSAPGVTIDNIAVAVPDAVPEPASLGVLALGGLALLARRRK